MCEMYSLVFQIVSDGQHVQKTRIFLFGGHDNFFDRRREPEQFTAA